MEGKASEKLEEIGKQYLDNLINNFDSKSLSQNKSSIKEENHPLKNLNKKKIFIENNPCINQGEDYYPELIPSFTILFATEMGTAEEFANTLQKEATEKLHLKAKVINVADVKDVKIFNESSLIVIIASTWGEGEPTDDCIEFNKMLKSKDFWDSFTNKDNLNVAVFGLGNTVYTFYNAQGKLFYKILVEENHLNPICELGLGNARGDIEQDFADWKDKIFFKKLYEFYSKNYEKNHEFYKKYNLLNEIVEKEEKEVAKNYELFSSEKKELINIDKKNYNQQVQNHLNTQKLKILNIEELRQNNTNGSTLKISFDLTGTNIKYNPAVNVLIYPKNKEEIVNVVFNQLAMDKENNYINYKILNNSKESLNLPLPEGITVKEALTEYIDLSCQINKNILSKLIMNLTDVDQKNKIIEIINDENKLSEFLSKNYNIADFIKEFDSLQLSLQELSEIFPSINPRYYTCGSSFNKKNNLIEIIITLVSWNGPQKDKRYGITSNYFNELFKANTYKTKDEYANIALKESEFKLPSNLQTPILMLCTGSGIAPFNSFLEELDFNKSKNNEIKYETYLIFGSMNKKNDFILEKELEEFKKKGILTDYYTAFSRDQEKKVYVQDILGINFNKEKMENLIINKGMHVYICGSTSMGNAVNNKLKEIIGNDNYEKMIKNGQLMSETWENKK